ncbi:MAG: hypothetical protein EAX89_14570 [Candidatus Lokiarchaeota archaeon]|nr:hypothetical protein [Candidatus Lokiarchaeota archaeon]
MKMTYETSKVQGQEGKQGEKMSCVHECPLCKKKVRISIDFAELKHNNGELGGFVPHIILHGEPLHAMLCYIDRHMEIRGKGYVVSIGISKDSNMYQQFTRL